MIGPQLRKALRWGAVVYVLYSAFLIASMLVEQSRLPDYVDHQPLLTWLGPIGALAQAVVQAGILLALLSIDERLGLKASVRTRDEVQS